MRREIGLDFLNGMSDEELASGLREWFERVDGVSSGSRRKSAVWVAMREILVHWGNWCNAPRGNPKKGFRAMKEKGNQ